MDRDSVAGPVEWLQRNPLIIVVVIALALLLILVWKQGAILPGAMPPPTAGTPVTATALPRQWAALTGLFDGRINTLLIDNTGRLRAIYAGTDGGVFRSEDQGRTWISCNNGLSDRLVRALAIDPDDPNVLYAGTWNGKVHVSNDGASRWQERSSGLPPLEIQALAVHTHDPRKLYAGTRDGVFISTNSGQEWHPAAAFTGILQCMAMDVEHPETLYVGTAEHGIYKTIDGGASWFSLRTGFGSISSLVIPPRTTGTVYAISGGKIYRTENAGVLWTYEDYWRDPAAARSLAVNPKNAEEVYVGLQDGLYKSEDARQTWARSDIGLRGRDLRVLVVDPIEPNVVYACTGNQLFASVNSGRVWEQRSSIQAYTAASILSLKADPKDGDAFYASVAGGGLYKTSDGGEHWEHYGESLPLAQITAVEVDPVDTKTVYAGTREGFVFRSTGGGTAWTSGSRVAEAPIQTLAVDPEQAARIYAGTRGRGLYRSDDKGAQWAHKGDDIGTDVRRVVIDSRGPQTTVYALTEEGVFRSRDSGETWELYLSQVVDIATPLKGSLGPVVVTRADPSLVTGQGRLEATLVPQSQVAAGIELKGLTSSLAMPEALYIIADTQGIFMSTDLGGSWTSLGPGLESRALQALALSPDDPQLILVGTDQGIYRYEPHR
jgi:photosystem II stability/assembly factor-like uncharacterized protein